MASSPGAAMSIIPKAYLGDGVYIEMTPAGFVLTTENGVAVTNTIHLDMGTLKNLMEWIETTIAKIERDRQHEKN